MYKITQKGHMSTPSVLHLETDGLLTFYFELKIVCTSIHAIGIVQITISSLLRD